MPFSTPSPSLSHPMLNPETEHGQNTSSISFTHNENCSTDGPPSQETDSASANASQEAASSTTQKCHDTEVAPAYCPPAIPLLLTQFEKKSDEFHSDSCTPTSHSCQKLSQEGPVGIIDDKTIICMNSRCTMEHSSRRICSAFFVYFVCGWGDSVTGTLIPQFRKDLGMNYTDSSLLFVIGTATYIVGTLLIEPLMNILGNIDLSNAKPRFLPALDYLQLCNRKENPARKIGYSQTQSRFLLLLCASVLHGIFFVLSGTSRSFATTLVAYAFSTLARAFFTGSLNAYVNNHPKVSLGHLHGFWALGSVMSPLVCQSLLSRHISWRNFYLGSLSLAALNMTAIFFAYRPTLTEFEVDRSAPPTELPINVQFSRSSTYQSGKEKNLQKTLRSRRVWAFSVFQALYVGSETVTQGFIVLFILTQRAGQSNTAGYVDSGFWAGETISRITFGFFYPKMSSRTVKYILHANLFLFVALVACFNSPSNHVRSVISLLLHILVWVVPSAMAAGVFTALIGLVYGPIFPLGIALATRMLPKEIHMLGMAIMSMVGNVGNAIFPFIAGLLSNNVGVQSYNYLLVALGVIMVILWSFLPCTTHDGD